MRNIVLNIMNTLNHYLIPFARALLSARICMLLWICLMAFNVFAQDEVNPAPKEGVVDEPLGSDAKREGGDTSSEPAGEVIPRFQPEIDAMHKQQLMDAFLQENANRFRVSGELVTLNTADTPFLAVWESNRHRTPLGAVLLLHGEGQTLDSPQVINVIRSSLPDHGWATLSVSMNTPQKKMIPKRIIKVVKLADEAVEVEVEVEGGEPGPDIEKENSPAIQDDEVGDFTEGNTARAGASEDESQDAAALALLMKEQDTVYAQDVLARLQSSLAFLNEKGQYNIAIVAHGTGALYVKQLVDQMQETSSASAGAISTAIRAVIMVNARNISAHGTQDITTLFTEGEYPILDVYFDNHVADQMESKKRLKAARRAKHKDYYQIKIAEPSTRFHDDENRLTRRVRGFLNRFAKGVEIEG